MIHQTTQDARTKEVNYVQAHWDVRVVSDNDDFDHQFLRAVYARKNDEPKATLVCLGRGGVAMAVRGVGAVRWNRGTVH